MPGPWEKYQSTSGPWDKYASEGSAVIPTPPETSAGQAALTGAQQAITLGYVPQIQGGIGAALGNPTEDLNKKLQSQGFKINETPSDYLSERDAAVKNIDKQQAEHPAAYAGGMLGGAALTLPIMPASSGSVGGRMAQALTTGAVTGGLQNPGDTSGIVDPLQLSERKSGLLKGAGYGLAAQGLGEAVGAGVGALRKTGEGLKEASDSMVLKQVGATKKDFKELYKKDKISEMSDFIKKSGIINGTPSPESVIDRIKVLNKAAGSKLENIYNTLDSSQIKANPSEIMDSLIDRVSKSSARPDLPSDAKVFDDKMLTLLEDIQAKGEALKNPKKVNDIIGEIDGKINYSKMSKELPAVQRGYYEVRDALRVYLKGLSSKVGEATGNKGLLKDYMAANDAYGKTKQLLNMAENKASAVATNRMMSPTDYGAMLMGGILGGASGKDEGPGGIAKKVLLYGAGGALANRAARRMGPGFLAKAGSAASGAGKILTPIEKALIETPVQKGLLAPALLRKNNE